MSVAPKNMDRVAMALGQGNMHWNSIEFMLHGLCVNLARFHDRNFDNPDVAHVIDIAVFAMDARQRIVVAKALAADGLDPDLYAEVDKLLNHIDNQLRPERNRYVHDIWQEHDNKIVRSTWKPKVTRPQSRQLEVTYSTETHYNTAEDVEGFTTRMQEALGSLIDKVNELQELSLSIWPLEESE
jgi:hypothetical protein